MRSADVVVRKLDMLLGRMQLQSMRGQLSTRPGFTALVLDRSARYAGDIYPRRYGDLYSCLKVKVLNYRSRPQG